MDESQSMIAADLGQPAQEGVGGPPRRRRMSIFASLMAIVMAALVPAAVIASIELYEMRAAQTRDVRAHLDRMLAAAEAEQSRLMDGMRQVLGVVAQTDVVRDGDAKSCAGFMSRLEPSYPEYVVIEVSDADGRVWCSTEPWLVGARIGAQPHHAEAMATHGFVVGSHVDQRPKGMPALPFSLPYTDRNGAVRGVVTALVGVDWLAEHVGTRPLSDGAVLLMTDRDGMIIGRAPERDGVIGMRLPDRMMPLLRDGPRRLLEVNGLDGVRRTAMISPPSADPNGVFLGIGIETAEVQGRIMATAARQTALVGLMTLVAVLGIWFGARRLLSAPMAALAMASRRWRAGDLSARARVTSGAREIVALADDFDAMAEALQEQVRTREAALAEALRLAEVIDGTADGIVSVDRSWGVRYANASARRIMRAADGDLWTVLPDLAADAPRGRLSIAMAERTMATIEVEAEDGGHALGVQAHPAIGGLTLFLTDLSERRRLERGLRRTEALFERVLETLPVGVSIVGPDGSLLRMNPRAESIWRESFGVGVGDNSFEALADADASIRRALAAESDVTNALFEGRDRTGRMRIISNAFAPIAMDGLRSHGAVMVSEDITERARSERLVREQEARLRAIVATASDAIVIVSERGIIVRVNGAAEAMLGHLADAMVGYRAETFLALPDAAGVGPFEVLIRRPDGTEVAAEAAVGHWESEGRIQKTWMLRDVTARRAAEAAMRRGREEAERAARLKSRFLEAISHDLRQPVQSLVLRVDTLRRHISTEIGRKRLETLSGSVDTLASMLDRLLDVSQIDAGLIQANHINVDAEASIARLIASLSGVANAKGLTLRSTGGDGVIVRTDPALLDRILRCLAENAIKYTVSGTITIACRAEGGVARLSVEDTGIGIPPDHLSEIFEELHQVGNPERDREQGLGLGLPIARRLASLLDHRLEVSSEPGVGSVFTVVLPCGADITGKKRGLRIVVIEDEPFVRTGLEIVCSDLGHDPLSFASADEAVAALSNAAPPDMIIADYRLQDRKTGVEAIASIRQMFARQIPGLVLTGEVGDEVRRDAARCCLPVASKPVNEEHIAALIESAVCER